MPPQPPPSNTSDNSGRRPSVPPPGGTVGPDIPPDEEQLWTAREMRILRGNVQNYKDAPRLSKSDFIRNTIVPLIKATWDHKYSEVAMRADKALFNEWKAKKDRLFNWFANHASTPRNTKLDGMHGRATFQSVFREKKAAEIEEEVQLLSGNARRGSPQWIKFYQQARKRVESRLTIAEREEYARILEEWKKKGFSKTLKAKTAKRQGKKILHQMDRIKWLRMGMRSITFEGHYDLDGKIEYSMTQTHDLGLDDPRIPSFGQLFPDELKSFRRAFVKYLVKVSEIENGVSTPAVPAGTFLEKDLKFNSNGFPLVPSPIYNSKGRETNAIQKTIIRIYMNRVYALAKDRSGSRIPWDSVEKHFGEMIDPEYWPSSIPFTDPSRLRVDDTAALLRHWRQRQSRGLIPFKFERVLARDNEELLEPCYASNLFEGLQTVPITPAPRRLTTSRRVRRRPCQTSLSFSEQSNPSDTHDGHPQQDSISVDSPGVGTASRARDDTQADNTRNDIRAEQPRDNTQANNPRDAARADEHREDTQADPPRDVTRAEQRRDDSQELTIPTNGSPTVVNSSLRPTPELQQPGTSKAIRKVQPRPRKKNQKLIGSSEANDPVPPPAARASRRKQTSDDLALQEANNLGLTAKKRRKARAKK
uniref:Uncharacterized protein n=1 Tax=Psilocybe cubensis TaxID=181762 RepID=A0A8H7XHR1_PSICU